MEDGSAPPKAVVIERLCGYGRTSVAARTERDGKYLIRLTEFDPLQSISATRRAGLTMNVCFLRAALPGYESSMVNLDTIKPFNEPELPVIKLRPRSASEMAIPDGSAPVPKKLQKRWEHVGKLVRENQWSQAESELKALVAADPKFAPAWSLLGVAAQNQNRLDDARSNYQRAIQVDPKELGPRYLLLEMEINESRWEAGRDAAAELVRLDASRRYPEARIYESIARYNLKDLDGAQKAAEEALRTDPARSARAEYVLGRLFEIRGNVPQALVHYRGYLKAAPEAVDAGPLRDRVAKLESGQAVEPEAVIGGPSLDASVDGDVWIPGGIQALSRIAHTEGDLSRERFFETYCRALVRYNTPGQLAGIPGYLDSLRSYFAAVAELTRLGTKEGDRAKVSLSLSGEQRKATAHALSLMGWNVTGGPDGIRVELGDTPADGPKQAVPAALGIDAIAMQETLNAGRSFEFEILTGKARIVGGDSWVGMIRRTRPVSGGLAEAFADESLLAKAYAGISSARPNVAPMLITALGARNLATRYADPLYRYASAFEVVNGVVSAPGGPAAEPVWQKLTGVSPRNAQAFLRAVLDKDRGTMASFYSALHRGKPETQAFLTSADNASLAYRWFVEAGVDKTIRLIEQIAVDPDGSLHLPGGAQAWTDSTTGKSLPEAATMERVIALSKLEAERGAPFDSASVMLIRRNYAAWQPVLPYFGRIGGLGQQEFEALDAFTSAVRRQSAAQREPALGAWYVLIELLARFEPAPEQSREVFRAACQPSPTAASILTAIRLLTGDGPGLQERIIARLAAKGAADHERFDRVLNEPRFPSVDAAAATGQTPAILNALTALLYAASFPPDSLLVTEDPEIVRKHRFMASTDPAGPLFAAPELLSGPNGSHFAGGFLDLSQKAHALARASETNPTAVAPATAVSAINATGPQDLAPPEKVYRAEARLVMVFATVTDSRGKYVDDLTASSFQIVEDGAPKPAAAFESYSSGVSCALLLDTTGSMHQALPALKSAALRFIDDLRPVDTVAVYGFSDSVKELQPFTSDKNSARRAVLNTFPYGQTALYDALARVSRDLAARPGKKVIVVFTDGDDNASTLAAGLVTNRLKSAGNPVYTIAQGGALLSPALLKQLSGLSSATGGLPFQAQRAAEAAPIFARIADELAHGYLLSFQPSGTKESGSWHKLEVQLKGDKRYKVRAREGYFLE